MTRVCRRCGLPKSDADFRDERHRQCKACCSIVSKQWKKRNREHVREQGRNWRERNRIAALLSGARVRAAKKKIDFSLTEADVVIPERCPVLGIELSARGGVGYGHYDATPTIDRIEPSLGYVPGNVAVISGRANRIKSNGSADEHEKVATWMRKMARETGVVAA